MTNHVHHCTCGRELVIVNDRKITRTEFKGIYQCPKCNYVYIRNDSIVSLRHNPLKVYESQEHQDRVEMRYQNAKKLREWRARKAAREAEAAQS